LIIEKTVYPTPAATGPVAKLKNSSKHTCCKHNPTSKLQTSKKFILAKQMLTHEPCQYQALNTQA
jgi:hypothetical protein